MGGPQFPLAQAMMRKGRSPRVREFFNLPDGGTTKDPDVYIKAWRDFAKPLLVALGDHPILFGYDPGLAIMWRGHLRHFDVDVVMAIFHKKGN